jgi:hypothetical protein
MTYNFVENTANDKIQSLQAIVDDDGSIKFTAPNLGSSNFDGFIPINTASAYVNNVNAGDYFSPSGSSTFYQVVSVEREDPSLTQTGSAYSGYQDIYYVDDNGELTSASFSSSAAVVYLKNEEWDSEERFLGNNGWIITSGGNAIFTNVAIRGRVEASEGFIGGVDQGWQITENLFSNASVGFYAPSATTGQVAIFAGAPFANRASAAFRVGYDGSVVASSANITGALTATTLNVGGSAGITYDGSIVTIGSSVVINSALTTNSLQVGASPALLKIANNVSGSNSGIYISSANYWYSTGDFSLGGQQGVTFTGGSVVIGTDVYVNAGVTVNALTVGTSPNILKISASPAGSPGNDGIYINNNNYWFSNGYFGVGSSVNSVVWNGTFLTVTGSIAATSITASVGNVGGFALAKNQLSASQVILSSSGGLRLGATNQFSVDQSGNLVATTASISGNITANSGTFTGSISAQHITASTGNIAGFTLANNQMSTASVIVSSSGGFRLGNPTIFSVDQFGNLVASTASITGRINATSGSFSGDITAAAGRFTGSVTVSSGGKFIAGTVDNGVVLDDGGLTGFSNGSTMFRIPTTGSPTLAGFTIINSGLTGSGQNANIIVGNTGSAANSITIRGDKTGGQNAAIFTVQAGVATSSATGNGFYVDDAGRMRLAGSNGSLTFDGNNLSVTGSVRAQHITASTGLVGGWTLSSSGLVGGSGTNTVGIISVPNSSSITIFAGNATASSAPFQVTNLGKMTATNAEISGQITSASITSTYGEIAGWILSSSALTGGSGDNTVGLISTPAVDNISIYAGSATAANAPFRVTKTGNMVSTSGSIGGFVISANSLTAGVSTSSTVVGIIPGSVPFFAGATATSSAGAKLFITNSGTLVSASQSASTTISQGFILANSTEQEGGGFIAKYPSTTEQIHMNYYRIKLRNNSNNYSEISYNASDLLTISSASSVKIDFGGFGNFSVTKSGVERLKVDSNGLVVKGTTNLSDGLVDLTGGGSIAGAWSVNVSSANPGRYLAITGTSGAGNLRIGAPIASSIRYKNNLEDFIVHDKYWFNRLLNFRLFNFNGLEQEKKDFGIIIEEVEHIEELDFIIKRDENNLPEMFQYEKVALLLIPAIKDMKTLIDKQQEIIENLKVRVVQLETLIERNNNV